MNPVLQAILNALGSYLQKHPDQVEALVEWLVTFIVAEVKKSQPTA